MPLVVRNALGILLIVLGILALPVPVVPGLPIIAAGAAVLGPCHPLVMSFRKWLKDRGFASRAK